MLKLLLKLLSPSLKEKVLDLSCLDLREFLIERTLRLEVKRPLNEHAAKSSKKALQHRLGEEGVHVRVRGQLRDFTGLEVLDRVVFDGELDTLGLLGVLHELIPRDLVPNDIGLLVPLRRPNEHRDKACDVKGVGKGHELVARPRNSGKIVRNVDYQSERALVRLNLGEHPVVSKVAVVHSSVLEGRRCF